MARVLHLLKGDHAAEAVAVIARAGRGRRRRSPSRSLGGADAPALPAGVTVHRVPGETSYEALVELIFTADQVVTW